MIFFDWLEVPSTNYSSSTCTYFLQQLQRKLRKLYIATTVTTYLQTPKSSTPLPSCCCLHFSNRYVFDSCVQDFLHYYDGCISSTPLRFTIASCTHNYRLHFQAIASEIADFMTWQLSNSNSLTVTLVVVDQLGLSTNSFQNLAGHNFCRLELETILLTNCILLTNPRHFAILL